MSQKTRNVVLPLLVMVMVWSLVLPAPVATPVMAESAVTFSNSTAVSNFRQNLIFSVTAKSSGAKIVSAWLLMREPGSKNAARYRTASFTPAVQVDLEYVQETAGFTTPPWDIVLYQWEVVDADGGKYHSDEFTAEYADSTRNWQKLDGEGVSVYWYDQPDSFGKLVLASAELGFRYVSEATNFTPENAIRIVVYNTPSAYCSYWAAYQCKDWYAATAHGTVVVTQDFPLDRSFLLDEVIPHELAHAFLYLRVGDHMDQIPNWFNEGQAMNNEIASIEDEIGRARELARSGQIVRLRLMEAQTSITYDESQAVSDWYSIATSLVYFLYEEFTPGVLGDILDGVANDLTFEDALEAATGWTLDDYELAWRAWLGVTAPPPTYLPTETMPPFFATPTFVPTKAA